MTAELRADGWVPAKGELAPGMLLDERFEITELVARSYQASIFRARDRQSGEFVAVKAPLLAVESDLAGFERFQREQKIGESLDHPSILRFLPVAERSRPYLVMEFIEGETLEALLQRGGALAEEDAVRIAVTVCEALEYLHRKGIAHRDIKPENLVFRPDGRLCLIDFGLACTARSRRLTFAKLTSVMGTPDYIAPERAEGKRGDHRSDVYSLGAILYRLVTGTPPFEGENPFVIMNARLIGDPAPPRSRRPELSQALEEVVLHALEREPGRRYQAAADLQRDLEHLEAVELTGRHLRLREATPARAGFSRCWPFLLGLVPLVVFAAMYLLFRRHH
jgi:serine/threonine protein kinase